MNAKHASREREREAPEVPATPGQSEELEALRLERDEQQQEAEHEDDARAERYPPDPILTALLFLAHDLLLVTPGCGNTSRAHSACFQPGMGVTRSSWGTNCDRSTSAYLWIRHGTET